LEKSWLKKYFKLPKFPSKWTPPAKSKKQKRPYIIPSRFGFYFGSGILVLIALALHLCQSIDLSDRLLLRQYPIYCHAFNEQQYQVGRDF
jgi:hypothetical protein